MWSKLYLAVLGLSFAVMSFFTYYSWSWLQSRGNPTDAAAGFEYHSSLSWAMLWLSAVALIALGNAVFWANEKSWAMWVTFIYFAAFVAIAYFWLGEGFFHFKKDRGISDGTFSVGPFFAVFLIAFSAVIVFLNQFAAVRLHRKMYPPVVAEPEPAAE